MTRGPSSGAVVVGVSPTSGSPAALRWALDEARLRGAALRAVLAWRTPGPPAAPGGRPPAGLAATAGDDRAAQAEGRLREFVQNAVGHAEAAAVDCVVVRGTALHALLATSRDAQLLVIGEPRGSRLRAVRAGLLAPQIVDKAGCPVVVMPATSASS